MENKYFIPDISDFHIGYEYERNDGEEWYSVTCDLYDARDLKTLLNKKVFDTFPKDKNRLDSEDYNNYYVTVELDRVRVPYLTKKQIEAEGWKLKNTHPEWPTFEKGNYWVTLITEEDKLPFIRIMGIDPMLIVGVKYLSSYNVYQGQCKSINELRKICKLLGI